MSEFLKSAMGYFQNPTSDNTENSFVGQVVDVGAIRLRVKRIIAEGGFAFVYVAQDVASNKEYALKRLLGADRNACNNIIKEINIQKLVSGHENIVEFVAASFIDHTQSRGNAEYLLITELCKGGSLVDCLQQPIEPPTVLKIIYQATRALSHLHSKSPPINHRDIKIENFLIGTDGFLKLCDFGSATTECYYPDLTWSTQQRNSLEEQIASVTTPMYRAPEQLDSWANYPIGPQSDIWALGCILYCLCFQRHPYEDSAKLRIMNGNYTIPSDQRYSCFHEIIKGCFIVDPSKRLTVNSILERLGAISETKGWPLKGPLNIKGKPVDSSPNEASPLHLNQPDRDDRRNSATVPNRPPPPRPHPPINESAHDRNKPNRPNEWSKPTEQSRGSFSDAGVGGSGLFSSIKGGAGSFFKNLKDTSSRVMQTVQQSIARTDLDRSSITSRILVMPCPSEGLESTYKTNNIEDVKVFVESQFTPSKLSVYNLGPRNSPKLPPPVRTVEAGDIFSTVPPRAPSLSGMYSLAEDMYGYLFADPKTVIIIQSNDNGRATAATLVCALLIYSHLVLETEDAMQIFAVKRCPPMLRPSEQRYLYYMSDVCRPTPHFPHCFPVTLVSLTLSPIPRMTKARDGCRIFMEIICQDKVVINTIQEYEKMRLYTVQEGKVTLNLNVTVCGDVTVTFYHARNALKGMGRPQGIKICQFQLNTGFIPREETLVNFDKSELDDLPSDEHIPNDFNIALSILVSDNEISQSPKQPWLASEGNFKRDPSILFGSLLEHEENVENFITKPSTIKSTSVPTRPPPRPTPPVVQKVLVAEEAIHCEVNDRDSPEIIKQEEPIIDLLNLNQHVKPEAQPNNVPSQNNESFDLLGGFTSELRMDNSMGNNKQHPQPLDDIFGSINNSGNGLESVNFNAFTTTNLNTGDFFTKSSSSGNIRQPTAEPTMHQSNSQSSIKDPFGDLGDLTGNLNINWTKQEGSRSTGPSPKSTNYSSPTHQFPGSNIPSNNSSAPTMNQHMGFNQPSQSQSKPSQPQTNNHTNSGSARPDYSRSNFDPPNKKATNGGSTAPAGSGDIFADILGQQGYSFAKSSQGPRSINEMRKEEIARDMDPDKLRILDWIDGKKNNIRALLCSLHTIVWEDAKWTKCEMHQLVSTAEVKKAYRKACLAVHPDKQMGTDNEKMAKMIFMELNNAWSEFDNDPQQQKLF